MLHPEQSLKDMARDMMDIVNCKKIIRDAIDNPVLEMARQMRREEEERIKALAKFADVGIAESARMRTLASDAEAAFRRSGAEEACAALSDQQELMQLALPDPKLADYLTSACPKNPIDEQTMRMAKMAESLAGDLMAVARQHSAMANEGASLAIRLSESHWQQALRNDYASIVESYAANPAVAHWHDIERRVQRWRPSTSAKPQARPPRHRGEDQTASAKAPDQSGSQHQPHPSSPSTNEAILRRIVIERSCPPVQFRHCYTIVGVVEVELRLFVARKLDERQLSIGELCAVFDQKISPKAQVSFAERSSKESTPDSILKSLDFTQMRELGRLVNAQEFSSFFGLSPSDRKLLEKALNKLNDRRNPVSHYRLSGDPDQILQEIKDLAAEVFRLIGLPTDIDALLHDIRDTPSSRTLH